MRQYKIQPDHETINPRQAKGKKKKKKKKKAMKLKHMKAKPIGLGG